MNTLIVSDVFEAYYEGRKSAFHSDAKSSETAKREEKMRAEAANEERRIPKAA